MSYLKVHLKGNDFVTSEKLVKDRREVWSEADKAFSEIEKIVETLGHDKIQELHIHIEIENIAHHLGRIKGHCS